MLSKKNKKRVAKAKRTTKKYLTKWGIRQPRTNPKILTPEEFYETLSDFRISTLNDDFDQQQLFNKLNKEYTKTYKECHS